MCHLEENIPKYQPIHVNKLFSENHISDPCQYLNKLATIIKYGEKLPGDIRNVSLQSRKCIPVVAKIQIQPCV